MYVLVCVYLMGGWMEGKCLCVWVCVLKFLLVVVRFLRGGVSYVCVYV